MHITANTRASGNEPNEDWFVATDNLAIVLDGATIRTDTGCIHGLPWFVHKLGATLLSSAMNFDVSLQDVLADSISYVSSLHAGTCELNHPGTPSAAVGLVRWTDSSVEWIVLGDITVIIEADGVIQAISDDRVSQTASAERRECDKYLIGTDKKLEAILTMKEVELASRNREGGYWIASTIPEAAIHAHIGSVPIEHIERYALCSDGAMRALELTSIGSAEGVLRILQKMGPDALIDQVRLAENRDPVGKRVPRNKAIDDATAILVEAPENQYLTEGHTRDMSISPRFDTHNLFGANPAVDGRVYG